MSETTYKSLQFYAPQDVRVEQLPIPEPNAGEVLIRVGAATTCGTDFKTYNRGHPVIIKTIPSAFGHEMSGTIVKLGDGVTHFNIGDRVALANSAPCEDCAFCKLNRPNLCENLVFVNGGFAEYLIIPREIVLRNTYKIPQKLSFAKAALTEPLACVLQACEHMRVQKEESVVIVGTGPMSFLFLEVLKAIGAKPIILGRQDEKLAQAKTHGAYATFNMQSDYVEELYKLTNGIGPDVIFDATGQPEIWELCVSLVRRGGRVCFYGGCAKGTSMTLDTYRVHYEEITFSGIFHHTPIMIQKALDWLIDDKIQTEHFLNHVRQLEELPDVFKKVDAPTDALKFVYIPTTLSP